MPAHALETEPIRDELEALARNAPPFPNLAPQNGAAEFNKRLAAGLDRVRGAALQRAKTANKRLRTWSIVSASFSFALGTTLGYILSTRRSGKIPRAHL